MLNIKVNCSTYTFVWSLVLRGSLVSYTLGEDITPSVRSLALIDLKQCLNNSALIGLGDDVAQGAH